MMGSLVYVGGLAARGGARRRRHRRCDASATSSCASATPGRCRARRPRPHAFVELHIEQGPVLEARGHHDRRGRRRAGNLVAGAHGRRAVQPRRHHADGDAPRRRRTRAAEIVAFVRRLAERDRRPPGRDRRSARSPPRPRQRGRRASRRSPSTCATPTTRCCSDAEAASGGVRAASSSAAEGVTIASRSLARFEPVDLRPRRWSSSSRGPRRRSATRCAACHRAPATTRRCSRGCARRRWCSCRAERHQPQPRRAHRSRPTSRPAPTCCCRCCSTLADAERPEGASHEPSRHSRCGPDGTGATRRTPGPMSSSGCSPCLHERARARRRARRLSPSSRSPRSSLAGTSRTTPSSTCGSRPRCRRPRPSPSSTRPLASASASASASPS